MMAMTSIHYHITRVKSKWQYLGKISYKIEISIANGCSQAETSKQRRKQINSQRKKRKKLLFLIFKAMQIYQRDRERYKSMYKSETTYQ